MLTEDAVLILNNGLTENTFKTIGDKIDTISFMDK